MSGKVLLVQETDEDLQAGTLMYVPVYRPNMPATTAAERQAALVGWVYSPYRMDDLIAGILDDWDLHETHRVRLAIFGGAGVAPERLLYDCREDEPLAETPAAGQVRVPVDFNGKVWTLRVSRAAAFPAAVTDPKVLLVAWGDADQPAVGGPDAGPEPGSLAGGATGRAHPRKRVRQRGAVALSARREP